MTNTATLLSRRPPDREGLEAIPDPDSSIRERGEGGSPPYLYVFNDPINRVDPSGHEDQPDEPLFPDRKMSDYDEIIQHNIFMRNPPSATQPAKLPMQYGIMDRYELPLKNIIDTPKKQIASVGVALGLIYNQLDVKDKDSLGLFIDTQSGILNVLANNAPTKDLQEEEWLLRVCEDFIRPLAESLYERSKHIPITNGGWAAFFTSLDKGEFANVKITVKGDVGVPVPERYAIARAMALNHIRKDLRDALVTNGIGRQELWEYIGHVVDSQSKLALPSPVEGTGMELAAWWWPDAWNVSIIRDKMRFAIPPARPAIPAPTTQP